MIEATITAEDLTLYALGLLEGTEAAQVEAMLRKSTAAREELASIRGDLALFAMAAEPHSPPALTRQRLMKQVARERRTVPVDVPVQDSGRPSAHTFRMDRENAPAERLDPRSGAAAPPSRAASVSDPLADPEAHASPVQTKPLPTRTFVRSQQARIAGPVASAQQAPPTTPRAAREVEPALPVPPVQSFSAGATGFPGDSLSPSAERETFSPDPHVFPREARSLVTSATAHSVTMFEQHFAGEEAQRSRETRVSPEAEAYSARRQPEPVAALAAVQDTFVPSNAAQDESFAFSSYRDHDAEELQGKPAMRWLGWTGWTLAAALTVAAVFALRDDFSLREQVSQQGSTLSATEASAARAETVLQTLQSASTQHFQIAATDAAPSPSGRVAYLPERGTLIFQGSNLETLQPYKTYELWLIPAGQGREPIPAGLFKPDAHGYATVLLPQLPKGVVATNFGVTIEDEGGAGTPTLPILLVGQQT